MLRIQRLIISWAREICKQFNSGVSTKNLSANNLLRNSENLPLLSVMEPTERQ